MKKDPKIIVEKIMELLFELAELAGVPAEKNTSKKSTFSAKKKEASGATGGIRTLVDEGKLNSPKQLPEIIEFLKQEGRHYSKQTISMGLLNLVRERILTRIRNTNDKKWSYVIRK